MHHVPTLHTNAGNTNSLLPHSHLVSRQGVGPDMAWDRAGKAVKPGVRTSAAVEL